jgi:HAD superfamily hydrolase (TIGR01509 family)
LHHDLLGLLFDFDGTIAETERNGHRVAYNEAFEAVGLDWNWDEALYGDLLSVTGGKERLHYYLSRYRPELTDAPGNDRLIASIYNEKIHAFDAIAPTIPLRPGVRALILAARDAGIKVGIATTASKAGVQALLSQDPELAGAIALIAAGDVVAHKKPAPDIYTWALDQLSLSPEACIAIEDSNIGLRAALAAGLTTLVTPSDYTKSEDFTGAARVVPDLSAVTLADLRAL